jgi:hypothetical protein
MVEEAIKPKRSRLAQSRIDYIVFGNPKQVGKLVYDYGFVPPGSLEELSEAVHELIRAKGKKVVLDLVRLHPDREIIISLTKNVKSGGEDYAAAKEQKADAQVKEEKKLEETKVEPEEKLKQKSGCATCGKNHQKEDSYCGCTHSYDAYNSFDSSAAKDNLSALEVSDLMVRYEVLSKQSLANPENKATADEATRVWNEIRMRNQSQKKKEPLLSIGNKEAFIILSLTIIAGILVGLSFRVPRTIKAND